MDTNIRKCLRLLQGEGGTANITTELINECMKEILSGKATHAQMGAFLMGIKPEHLHAETLVASANAMASFAIEFPVVGKGDDVVLDIVGTGGDKHDTFNASTAAAFLVGSLGVKVAKHGNRSSSGRCGSADLVEALGANIMLDSPQLQKIFENCGFSFLFAPKFHPAMKAVVPVRKEIGVRTIFNILGPLVNPANPTHMLVGVGSEAIGALYADVLALRGIKKAMVVHSDSGLDEIGVDGPTTVWRVENGKVVEKYKISPEDFGLPVHPVAHFCGDHPEHNVGLFRKILAGEEGPVTDFLLANTAAALVVADKAKTLKEGVEIARKVLKDGTTQKFIEQYIQLTNASN